PSRHVVISYAISNVPNTTCNRCPRTFLLPIFPIGQQLQHNVTTVIARDRYHGLDTTDRRAPLPQGSCPWRAAAIDRLRRSGLWHTPLRTRASQLQVRRFLDRIQE